MTLPDDEVMWPRSLPVLNIWAAKGFLNTDFLGNPQAGPVIFSPSGAPEGPTSIPWHTKVGGSNFEARPPKWNFFSMPHKFMRIEVFRTYWYQTGFPLSGKSGNSVLTGMSGNCQGFLPFVREILRSNAVCLVVYLLALLISLFLVILLYWTCMDKRDHYDLRG